MTVFENIATRNVRNMRWRTKRDRSRDRQVEHRAQIAGREEDTETHLEGQVIYVRALWVTVTVFHRDNRTNFYCGKCMFVLRVVTQATP